MILKDKFHSPKIKRTPSKKGKQAQPEPAAKSAEKPANKVSNRNSSLSLFMIFLFSSVFRFHILLLLATYEKGSLLRPIASQSPGNPAALQLVLKDVMKAELLP